MATLRGLTSSVRNVWPFLRVGFLRIGRLQESAAVRTLAGALALVIVVSVLAYLPRWQGAQWADHVAPDQVPTLINEFRRTLAQIIGGFALLLGLYFTWKRIEVAREEQLTERFTRAIDQLGSDKLEIRVGAIYALERIARDSRRDHWTVIEVLCAFVRERARWKESRSESRTPRELRSGLAPTPPTDIQAALTVVGRRRWWNAQDQQPIDLRGTDLRGARLYGGHMEGALLSNSNLDFADLREAHLEGATLWRASLQHARLERAHLHSAFLANADLESADTNLADLSDAILSGTHLDGTDESE
jgi:Pentapeptide repeats (8 copies)